MRRMGSYDFDALKSDLDKYNEKCPMVGISEDSRYIFKSKDSDENISQTIRTITKGE